MTVHSMLRPTLLTMGLIAALVAGCDRTPNEPAKAPAPVPATTPAPPPKPDVVAANIDT